MMRAGDVSDRGEDLGRLSDLPLSEKLLEEWSTCAPFLSLGLKGDARAAFS